jgi:hypothetical protein
MPSFLITFGEQSPDQTPIELENLKVSHNLHCVINPGSGSAEDGIFTVIHYNGKDDETVWYFLELIESVLQSLGSDPDRGAVNSAIERIALLFIELTKTPKKTIQGVWAELLVISKARHPGLLVDSWHVTPEDRYDFSWSNDSVSQRIEVKSTRQQTRLHSFSLEQLWPVGSAEVVVASVLLEEVASGCTISDLCNEIESASGVKSSQLEKIMRILQDTLGLAWAKRDSVAYDRAQARQSLKFYQSHHVPSVDPATPVEVRNVSFQADLTNAPPLSLHDIAGYPGIIKELA